LRRNMGPRRHRPFHKHAAADLHVYRLIDARHAYLHGLRAFLIALDEAQEGRSDIAIALATLRLRAAGAEYRIDPLAGACPRRNPTGERRRKDPVNADRADAFGIEAHIGEGVVRPVGNPIDIPLPDAEREPQVLEIGGTFDRVEGAKL